MKNLFKLFIKKKEEAPAPKFRIGQKVRIKFDEKWRHAGNIYTVTKVYPLTRYTKTEPIMWRYEFLEDIMLFHNEQDLECVYEMVKSSYTPEHIQQQIQKDIDNYIKNN